MKKTYIEPTMKVVMIMTNTILAASPGGVGASSQEMGSSDVQFGRSFDFDDED